MRGRGRMASGYYLSARVPMHMHDRGNDGQGCGHSKIESWRMGWTRLHLLGNRRDTYVSRKIER
jgi:hypothetical protein